MTKRFTGRHMAFIFVAFFGTVAAVNFTMARYAIGTFGGEVVENSYVASQEFNGWLESARESEALGWQVASTRQEDGRLLLRVEGAPADLIVGAVARHPLGQASDLEMSFGPAADGAYVSNEELPDGRWTIRYTIEDGSNVWRGEDTL